MSQSITQSWEEVNGRDFKKRFTKGTRAQQVAFAKAVASATIGTLVKQQESTPLAGTDLATAGSGDSYSDATLYFAKGALEDSYDFEQLTNDVSLGDGSVDIANSLMTAIEAAFVGNDGATGWTLTRGLYHR